VQTAEALGYNAVIFFNDVANAAPNCDAQLFPLAVGNIPSLFVGRSTGLKLLNTDPGANSCDVPTPPLGPGQSFSMAADFDGWGYLHLYDASTMEAVDHFAIPESLDESKAEGFGDLSVHEVAMDPGLNRAYVSYYSGGFRVFDFSREAGMQEVGAYIPSGGINLWGVEVHQLPSGDKPFVLASDRDSGLWIFRYRDPATGETTPTPQPADSGPPRPELKLDNRDGRRSIRAGKRLRYRLVLRNTGEAPARKVTVCDRISRKTKYRSSSRRGERRGGRKVCFTFNRIKPDTKRTVRVRVRVKPSANGKARNRARARAENARRVRDNAVVKIRPR
jgi:uncharacterized repeat protein (TIGR01451 family)